MKKRLRALAERPAPLLVVPLLLATLAYGRVLDGEFQFDDDSAIKTNTAVKDLGGFLGEEFLDGFRNGGRPVADLTFAMNYAAGGLVPWNFHLTSLAIHLLSVILAWALVRELLRLAGAGRPEWVALGVAGIFALHPIQTQAVSYIVQRSEVLASGLYLASLLLVVAAEKRGLRGRAWGLLAGAWLVFLLALGSKVVAMTLPAVWLLGAALLPSPQAAAQFAPWRRRFLAAVPFVGAGVLHAWAAVASTTRQSNVGFSLPGLTPWTYSLTQVRVVATYVRLLFLPVGQNVDWEFPSSSSLAEPAVILCAALLLAMVGGAVWLAAVAGRRIGGEAGAASRTAGFGVLWFFVLLAPTSSVVPIADVLMEHRVYLASLGVFLAVAVGVESLVARAPAWRARAAMAVLALVCATFAMATHARNAVWVSSKALWTDSAGKSPGKARPLTNLSYAVSNEGRFGEALRLAQEALKRSPASDAATLLILDDIASNQLSLGRPLEARATVERALQIGSTSGLFETLSAANLALKDVEQAERSAHRAVMSDPVNAEAWATGSDVAFVAGNKAEALSRAKRAYALDPDLFGARFSLGQALHGLGRDPEACMIWAALGRTTERNLPALRAEARCGSR